jgi:hypothetical protein
LMMMMKTTTTTMRMMMMMIFRLPRGTGYTVRVRYVGVSCFPWLSRCGLRIKFMTISLPPVSVSTHFGPRFNIVSTHFPELDPIFPSYIHLPTYFQIVSFF